MKYLLLCLLLCALPASADTLRCGSKLVYEGDLMAVVRSRCGQPAQISHSTILRFPTVWIRGRPHQLGDQQIEIPVETWVYNFGPRKFMRQLRFEDGVLVEIAALDYGYDE